jgi:hypothetical protein
MVILGSDGAKAAGEFASSIRSRRELLQTLYYATKNGSAEAWAFHQRRLVLPPEDGPHDSAAEKARQTLADGQHAAEATARDAAWAFVLIVDYAIRRLGADLMAAKSATPDPLAIGAESLHGVKLNDAVRAFANQARHLHDWMVLGATAIQTDRFSKASVATIKKLGYDPLEDDAAREFLQALNVNSYLHLEELLIQTARDVFKAEGYEMGPISPGSYSYGAKFPEPVPTSEG